jgi:hypothetical protein
MGHPDAALIFPPDPSGKVRIDPLPELLIFLDLVIGLGQGAATGAAESTEGRTVFFGEGEVTGSHQEIGIVIDRFDGVTATSKLRDVRDLDIKPLGHFPGRELVIGSPDRDCAAQK